MAAEIPKICLIVVDVQNEYFQGGALSCVGAEVAVEKISDAMKAELFPLVVATRDMKEDRPVDDEYWGNWAPHCVVGSRGYQLHKDLYRPKDLDIRDKTDSMSAFGSPSAAASSSLAVDLKKAGVESLVVCGVALEYCVLATATGGAYAGFKTVTLVLDGSAAYGMCQEKVDQRIAMKIQEAQEKTGVTVRMVKTFAEALLYSTHYVDNKRLTDDEDSGGGKTSEAELVTAASASTIVKSVSSIEYIDIGINICNRTLHSNWRDVINRARMNNVSKILLTGISMETSRESLAISKTSLAESKECFLYCTIGVHPHHAAEFCDASTAAEIRELVVSNPSLVVAVGECGLDFFRKLCPHEKQKAVFRAQVNLACELKKPMFVHERQAHKELLEILDEVRRFMPLPPIVIHCFTGTLSEAKAYIEQGFYIGFTGTICMEERGKELRKLVSELPLDRLLLETDAPFMGVHPSRKYSEPVDVSLVAKTIADCLGVSEAHVALSTTSNAKKFFRL